MGLDMRLVCMAAVSCVMLLISSGAFAEEKPQGIRSVGIISALGDRFHVRKVGLTVFDNDATSFAIESWRIDDLVVSKVRGLLSKRFNVRPVNYQKAPLASFEGGGPFKPGLADVVRRAVPQQGLDAYVVITKSPRQYGGTNQTVTGLGIIKVGSQLFGELFHLYALYSIALIDAHQMNVVDQRVAARPLQNLMDIIKKDFIQGPHRQVDESLWAAAHDATANAKLRAPTLELLEQDLPVTLGLMQSLN